MGRYGLRIQRGCARGATDDKMAFERREGKRGKVPFGGGTVEGEGVMIGVSDEEGAG